MKNRVKQINERSAGFVLLATMIVLVVLASLTAGLAMEMSMSKRRQQYMIEYQRARYGLDSAMKYILNVLPTETFPLITREEQPDFSDIFLMDRDDYSKFITSWAETAAVEEIESVLKEGASLTPLESYDDEDAMSELLSLLVDDANEAEGDSYGMDEEFYVVELDPNDVVVPGPYGPPWPLVTEPIDLEIGPCKIRITIEDENAKMPLSWFVTDSKKANEEAEYALQTFCEWISWGEISPTELETQILDSMEEVYKRKQFKLNPGPIIETTTTRTASKPKTSSRSRRRRRTTTRTATRTTTEKRPAIAHTTDFAKLFHSSLLDEELLAKPLPDTGERVESPLKYLSLWGAQRVNINTAPRNVLAAAFSLAGLGSFDVPEFTQKVIDARQEEPFKDLNELKDLGGINADTMKKFNNYLTTTSTFFQVHITSHSGNASSSAVATVVKEGKKTERLVILYQQ